jgi:DNA polymerase-3 subunit gamma/tau
LSKGFDAHHFVSGLASHFRDLLVSKNTCNFIFIRSRRTSTKMYGLQAQKQSRLSLGIEMANDCDLKYKVSQNQRLLVELCLMQLASITLMEKKVDQFIIPTTLKKSDYSIVESQKLNRKHYN